MVDGISAGEEQRRALAETLPPGTAADEVIRKLECSKRRFLESRAQRRSNTELAAERTRWRSRIKAWKKVRELEEPEWWERRAAALVRARLEEAAIRIDQLSVSIQAFARRQDPDREGVAVWRHIAPCLTAAAIFGAARGADALVVTIDRRAIRQRGAFILAAIQNL
jgi:hypothetical protein